MIRPGPLPGGGRLDFVLRFTMPDGSTVDMIRDDGSADWSEDAVEDALRRAVGTARRAEAAKARRRYRRPDQDDRLAG